MNLGPPSTHLPVPAPNSSRRGHRHKRSGAISGDFDINGLGLFVPSSSVDTEDFLQNPSSEIAGFKTGKLHGRSFSSSFVPSDMYSHSTCTSVENNMFEIEPNSKFEFPKFQYSSRPAATLSPGRNTRNPNPSALKSPVRFKNSASSYSNPGTPNFKFHDSPNFNLDAPVACIDLNQIVVAETNASEVKSHNRSESHFNDQSSMNPLEDSTPIVNPRSSMSTQLTGSPFSSPAYAKQAMREPFDAAIEEEEDSDGNDSILKDSRALGLRAMQPRETITSIEMEKFFVPAANTHQFYSSSVNSSASSLPMNSAAPYTAHPYTNIEKSVSNSSRDSAAPIFSSTGTPKRAVANRYQSFYDKSLKVSSYLKNSSNDSIALASSNFSPPAELIDNSREVLGHSSSLSSMRSSKNVSRLPLELSQDSCEEASDIPLEASSSSQEEIRRVRKLDISNSSTWGSQHLSGTESQAPCLPQYNQASSSVPSPGSILKSTSNAIDSKSVSSGNRKKELKESSKIIENESTKSRSRSGNKSRDELVSGSTSNRRSSSSRPEEKPKRASRLKFAQASTIAPTSMKSSDHKVDRFTNWFRRTK